MADKCDLNHIDISHIKDMSGLFSKSSFKVNISDWKPINLTKNEETLSTINSYHLAKKLELDINTKEVTHKKLKSNHCN